MREKWSRGELLGGGRNSETLEYFIGGCKGTKQGCNLVGDFFFFLTVLAKQYPPCSCEQDSIQIFLFLTQKILLSLINSTRNKFF